jgi:RNA polymerase sigma factor (sigma-70 family)
MGGSDPRGPEPRLDVTARPVLTPRKKDFCPRARPLQTCHVSVMADVAAATDSLQTYLPGLRRYFSKRLPAAEVDDLVQEVFVRIQAHEGGSPIQHLDRYLFTTAASVLSDHLRRRAVRHEGAHHTLEEFHHPVEELTPERVLLDQEALQVVVTAIESLPARTRDVFVLHRFEQMTCTAIAEQLGMSVSAVEKHIMKALRALHSRLAAD